MKFLDIHIANREQFEITDGFQPVSSIFYLLSGCFEIEISGKVYNVRSGDVFYLPDNLFFKRKVIDRISFYYIRLSDDEEYSDMYGILRPNSIVDIENSVKLLTADCNKNDKLQKAKNIVLESMFCRLKLKDYCSTKNDANLLKCINYLHSSFNKDIDLNTLCSVSGYSKTILIEKFKKYYNATPIQYLTFVRLNKARELLVDSKYSISEISEKCGFNCPYYFSNTFKKYCGYSPNQYRKKYII